MNALAPLVMSPLTAVYGAVVRSRRILYERGTFRRSKLAAPVISVGNITTGGTGKTPMVLWLASWLAQSGRKVCILTRGYRRRNAERLTIVSDGQEVCAGPDDAGDEPFLLATKLLGIASVISNADRKTAGDLAIEKFGTDTFILDDGFQHLQLNRDFDIVTIDATNPWGSGSLLPLGRLREPITSLSRADCIVLTRTHQVEEYKSILTHIAKASGGRPVLISRMQTRGYTRVVTGRTEREVPEVPLAAFCGIGNSKAFFQQVESEVGKDLVMKRAFSDHHSYSLKDIAMLVDEAKQQGAHSLVTTEKDAVKLTGFEFGLPCYALAIEIVIDDVQSLTNQIRDFVPGLT
ncbi:MAG: tetraacyldisaccharide 4'-kinase [Acidobacteria bacterium]|nr:MAG: tetraacyldisaccharide 4'-kinase [Acidobacteriota bacterium]